VTYMGTMFSENISFNQDLSNWSVGNVTECFGFSYNTPQWTLPQPNFTNCNPN
jgi:surface protein